MLPSNELIAVKRIEKKKLLKTGFRPMIDEIIVLKVTALKKHQNLVKFYDFKEKGEFIYIAMEYCDGGTLRQEMEMRKKDLLLKKRENLYSEDEALRIGYKILNGLRVLHQLDISHRDLKPENILLKNGEYKISDFGLATDRKQFISIRGTVIYMSPENHDPKKEKSKPVDI